MDGYTSMWMLLGCGMLLIGSMQLTSGLILVTAESMQRWMAGFIGILMLLLGWAVMVYLAAPRAPTGSFNMISGGSIAVGVLAAVLLGWKRMTS
jgi:hypothetical protein